MADKINGRPWNQPPSWDGDYVDLDMKNKFIPMVPTNVGNIPFAIQLDGSEDYWMPIFSDEDALNKVMYHLVKKLGIPSVWAIYCVEDATELVEKIAEEDVRVMFDPRIISDTHTQWHEPVKIGDVWKFKADQN